MKHLLILTTACIATIACSIKPTKAAQNSSSQDSLVLFPSGTRMGLYSTTNQELKLVRKLPFSGLDKISQGEDGWFAGVSQDGDSCITFAKYDESGDFDVWRDLLPYSEVKSVVFKGSVAFAGGNIDGDLVAFCDLSAKNPIWEGIPLPEELGKISKIIGKSVDALFLDGDRLIAVDNIVLPKWLIIFDVTNSRKPKALSASELKEHGVYEHVKTAALGENWLAVCSSTASAEGSYIHISFIDKKSFQERAVLSAMPSSTGMNDIAFSGDRLYVASGIEGIGILDIPPLGDGKNFQKQCSEGLKFITPSQIEGLKVIRVIPAKNSTLLGVVVERNRQIETVTLQLSAIQKLLEDTQTHTDFNTLREQHRALREHDGEE